MPGELSAKVIAKAFWHREVEEELGELGLRESWVLCKESGSLAGNYDHAMEMVDRMRCDHLYLHNCSEHCKSKGTIKVENT